MKKRYYAALFNANVVFIFSQLFLLLDSQCTYPFQRCICSTTTSTPYCPCSYITPSQTLNFSSTYYSHLTIVNNFGCRPCDSGCQKCTSPTVCTQCLEQFQLVANKCIPCPINCKTCKNAVCSICNSLYYLNYQNNCETCPLQGTNTCTIDSLTSCLSNYWLDNNGANCINCDSNCKVCASTTKCSICNQKFYEYNFKCYSCMSQCQSCSNSTFCTSCLNISQYFNSTTLSCVPCINNCLYCVNGYQCSVCRQNFSLSQQKLCLSLNSSKTISNCEFYLQNNASLVYCLQCFQDYYMLNYPNLTSCFATCSVLCLTCHGAHYGVCSQCQDNSVLINYNCLPKYNINNGTSFQRYYTALNNIDFFQNTNLQNPNYCWHEHLATTKTNYILINLNNLNSYKIQLRFKIYSFSNSSVDSSYDLFFYNSQINISEIVQYNVSKDCSTNRSQCNNSLFCIHKNFLIFEVIKSQNTLIFQSNSNLLSLSELLVVGYRCGGIHGDGCQQCSNINTCIKCSNPSFFIIGERCIIQCPSTYYTYFSKGICYQLCPQGTYSDDSLHQCLTCISPCQTCVSAQKCITCQNNTFLNTLTKQCLTQCPKKYYADSYRKICQKCVFPCLQCLHSYMCLSCVYGFYQNSSFSCLLQCYPGFFGDFQLRKCQKCQLPCFQCQGSQNNCKTCVSGYYLYQNQCLVKCPISYYQNYLKNLTICQKCDENCLNCQSLSTNCTQCKFGFYLLRQFNICLQVCPLQFYKNYLTLQCAKCANQCLKCTSETVCSSCVFPYLYDQSTYSCLTQCSKYFYAQNGSCFRCQLPCYDCFNASSCKSCYDSFLYNQTCIIQCPQSYYADVSTLQCLKCDTSKCFQCQTTNTTCISCQTGLLLIEGKCLSQCWLNFYYSSYKGECVLCEGLCQTCSNQTFCLSCINNFILIQNQGICTSACSSGYYKLPWNQTKSNISICQRCSNSCLSCEYDNNLMKQICLICQIAFFLLNESCYQSCPLEYYGYKQNLKCYKCSAPCKTCLNQYLCLSCNQNFGYLFEGQCLQNCPYKYFQDVVNNSFVCRQCDISCQFCQNLTYNCTSCQVGLFLTYQFNLTQNLFIGKCSLICSDGFFYSKFDNICFKCNQNCLTCKQFSQCTSCNNSDILHCILFQASCIKQCPISYYQHISSQQRTCLQCQNGCLLCLNSSFCLQCQNQYLMTQNNLCFNSCSLKYFEDNFLCKLCLFPCLTCISSSVCTSCIVGFFFNGSCLAQCPTGTFALNESYCSNCSVNCSICTSLLNCLFCVQGALYLGICVSKCQDGYYQFYGACIPCSFGCSLCTSSYDCNDCFSGFLFEGICVQYCPNGWVSTVQNSSLTYINSKQLSYCIKCNKSCSKCAINPNQCLECQPGYLLYINFCVTYCPFGSYPEYSLKNCQICISPCQTCTNAYSCQSCIYGYILYREDQRNQCVEGPYCPNSYYLNLDSNICQYQCSSDLFIDENKRTCSLSCDKGLASFQSNMSCLQHCPDSMWIDQNYFCRNNTDLLPEIILPVLSCKPFIIRNNLLIYCQSNIQLENINILTKDSFSLSFSKIQQINVGMVSDFCLITSQNETKIIQKYLKLAFVNPFTLLSKKQAKISNSNIKNRTLGTSSLQFQYPVQNYQMDIFIKEFYYFTSDQRSIGMNFYSIGQSIAIGALIIWFFSLIKNLKSTNLLYILNLQWLYTISLLSNNFAPNLNQFLQGLKISNLYFIQASKQSDSKLWTLFSKNIQAQGVNNLYNLNQVLLPIYSLILLFLTIFFISWILSKLNSQPQNKQNLNLSIKAKIIYDRFFYNYTFQICLFCSNSITLPVYFSLSNPSILSLIIGLILIVIYITGIVFSLYKLVKDKVKCYRATKYFFVQMTQIFIVNIVIVMNNFYFYVGLVIVLFTLKMFVWHIIFKKSQSSRCFHLQIIEIIKICLAVIFIVGEFKKQNWNSNDLYNYGFVQIFGCLFLIIISSIYVSKQLFSSQEHKPQKSNKNKSIKSLQKDDTLHQKINLNNSQQQQESQQSFFTNITPVQSDSSQEDIIDFDSTSSKNDEQKRPAQLYRYDKNDKEQQSYRF